MGKRGQGLVTATVFLVCVVASACAPNQATSDPAASGGLTIAVFTKNQTNPYFQSVRLGAESAARQAHVAVVHYVPTKPDSIPEQMSQIEDAITRRPSGVVFIPVDSKAMVPGVQRLNAARIPVVNIVDRSAGGEFVSFMACDEYGVALGTARYLLAKMNGRGSLVIIEGVGGSANNTERLRGFRAALADAPGVKVLASQPGNFQRLQALQVMENLLQSFPDVDAVLAANDAMALGAIEALESAGRHALVAGVNGTKEAVDAIKAGRLVASGQCDAYLQGCLGTMAAVRNARKQAVPREYAFPITILDRTNYTGADLPDGERSCPAWDALVKDIRE